VEESCDGARESREDCDSSSDREVVGEIGKDGENIGEEAGRLGAR
jgi:hypothetical protein